MPDLTPAADRYISATLRRDGRVPMEALDWVPEHERAELLQQYCLTHEGEFPVRYENGMLTLEAATAGPGSVAVPIPAEVAMPPAPPPDPVPAGPSITPMPPIYGGPGTGKALLDSKPAARPVSGWLYLLPLLFGLLGGIAGWLIVREENPRGARNVLVVGVTVSVLSFCLSLAIAGSMGSLLSGMSASSTSWPATGAATGRPALYYFGTST